MNRIRLILMVAVTLVVTILTSATASADSTTVLTGAALTGPSPQQSFVSDGNGNWIFAQVTYPVGPGNMTLTKIASDGTILGSMYLKGFGHGLSIGVEPVGSTTYLWTEAVAASEPALGGSASAGYYGTKIARFAWQDGATLTSTSPGVSLYLGNQPEETPSVDAARDLIAVHYWSPSSSQFRYVVYDLSEFEAHNYVPLANVVDPPYTATSQGWTLVSGRAIARLEGDSYSATNPAPGNTVLTTLDMDGTVLSRQLITAMPDLDYREPEGVTQAGLLVCEGFASGPAGTFHYANIVCGQ